MGTKTFESKFQKFKDVKVATLSRFQNSMPFPRLPDHFLQNPTANNDIIHANFILH